MKRMTTMIAGWVLSMLVVLGAIGPSTAHAQIESRDVNQAPGRTMAQQATKERQLWITADHSKHEVLQQAFSSGPEVTKACLSCHSEAAAQFHKTLHWTWMDPSTEDNLKLGKGGLSINNF